MRTSKNNILALLIGFLTLGTMLFTSTDYVQAQVQLQLDAVTSGGIPSSSGNIQLEGSIGQIATTSSAGNNVQSFPGLWSSFYSTDLITDIEPEEPLSNNIPGEFKLQHAYPNPFNPSTQISYELPEASHVKLTVYNMLGQQVRVLVNTRQKAGHYETTFQAQGMASGVYLYRLQTDNFTQERKMTLVK
ncbi:T9SS type A sorting domain-containing protein [Rhodohalobacter sp. 8-1]|uniref:T9SS type A sorting domain-containing protein n=1 Tax=Rhodohalobacter sp. 8-1 TaxID=3131972 RepID=UPI0030EF9DB2